MTEPWASRLDVAHGAQLLARIGHHRHADETEPAPQQEQGRLIAERQLERRQAVQPQRVALEAGERRGRRHNRGVGVAPAATTT